MPRYWLTRHYPHPPSLKILWNVYVQDRVDGEALAEGDIVAFYETAGPSPEQRYPSEREFVTKKDGRSAIVGIATVAGGVRPIAPECVLIFKEQSIRAYKWEVPCTDHKTGGSPIEHAQAMEILGTRNPYLIAGAVASIDETTYFKIEKGLGQLWASDAWDL